MDQTHRFWLETVTTLVSPSLFHPFTFSASNQWDLQNFTRNRPVHHRPAATRSSGTHEGVEQQEERGLAYQQGWAGQG